MYPSLNIGFCIRRPWPGPWARVVIIVIVLVACARWEPGATIPLAVGIGLGGWASARIAARRPALVVSA